MADDNNGGVNINDAVEIQDGNGNYVPVANTQSQVDADKNTAAADFAKAQTLHAESLGLQLNETLQPKNAAADKAQVESLNKQSYGNYAAGTAYTTAADEGEKQIQAAAAAAAAADAPPTQYLASNPNGVNPLTPVAATTTTAPTDSTSAYTNPTTLGQEPAISGLTNSSSSTAATTAPTATTTDPANAAPTAGGGSSSSSSDTTASTTDTTSTSTDPATTGTVAAGTTDGSTAATTAPTATTTDPTTTAAPAATVVSATPEPTTVTTDTSSNYVVQHGDTMSAIAAAHGVSLASLEAANKAIANPSLIYPGQTVNIPEGGTTVTSVTSGGAAADGSSAYTVKPGDTLSAIASSHGVSLHDLEAANGSISNPNVIHPGQTVNIPAGGTTTTTSSPENVGLGTKIASYINPFSGRSKN